DMGRQEVGPDPIVVAAERSTLTVMAEPFREETTYGIELDGHRPRHQSDASHRHVGPQRASDESPTRAGAETPPSPGDVTGGDGALAGCTGPRCTLCGQCATSPRSDCRAPFPPSQGLDRGRGRRF